MKKTLVALVLVLSILLAGCNSGNDNNSGANSGVFIGGTEGLKAVFEPIGVLEDGVFTIYDTEDFPLEILLTNKGEEPVPAGKVTLRLLGPAQGDFQNIPQWTVNNKEAIEKVSEFDPQGGEEIVSFTPSVLAKYTQPVTSFTDINWNVEYAYDYKTHVIINDVCFKEDLSDNKICEVQQSKTFALSGAPIAITAVEEDAAGKGIIVLRIKLQNVGTGDSTLLGEDFDARFEQVGYEIDEPERWECKSGGRENVARFVDNQAEVVCKLKQPLQEGDLFTKVVTFTAKYKYRELAQEKLRIKESVN